MTSESGLLLYNQMTVGPLAVVKTEVASLMHQAHGPSAAWVPDMYKLDLEKAEEPEIQLPKSIVNSKRVPEKLYFCFIDYANVFVLITTN